MCVSIYMCVCVHTHTHTHTLTGKGQERKKEGKASCFLWIVRLYKRSFFLFISVIVVINCGHLL